MASDMARKKEGAKGSGFSKKFSVPGREGFTTNDQIVRIYHQGGRYPPLVPVVALPAGQSAGVDGMYASVDPNTGFALITALRQSGDNLKVALLPTGYGGDLQQAGPTAQQIAQNVSFISLFEPVELHTPATMQFQSDLKGVGVTGDPTYAEYAGYTSIALLVQGLVYRRLAKRLREETFMTMGIALMGVGVASLGAITWMADQKAADIQTLSKGEIFLCWLASSR